MPDKTIILKCRHCSKSFKYDSERRRHEQSHSPQFQCKICSKNFSFISALRRHEKQHERTGTVQCTECSREFRDNILLKRHIKYAHGGTYTCAKCTAVFSSEPALKTHMKTHRSQSERRYQCSFTGCSKKFNFAHHLKHHEMTHTNTKQHFCKICNKGFIQSHHLKTHMKTHTSDSSLHCPYDDCGKTFSTEYAKKRHLAKYHFKQDSGISSDSNSACDFSYTPKLKIENDSITCPSCGQLIPTTQYEEHTFNCIQNVKNEVTKEVPANIFDNSVDSNFVDAAIDNEYVAHCKQMLGGCIMNDKGEKCVCAQITKTVDEEYDFTPIGNEPLDMTKTEVTSSITNNAIVNNNSCEGCECSQRCGVNVNAASNYQNDTAVVEYKPDGTVKLKDIFEMDILSMNTVKDEKPEIAKDNEANALPYNSCKAVLGNCIVSGNGMMGDGCLCARMLLDDQVTAQEIDDITPRPKTELFCD
ncbi:hypothetical protein HF086_015147 [Spodoptera exigua]|uniref:C2H2-type domain-containing protein n=1 Tax=Spodoptera exigua TaxID=7107 RepID=A0A922MCE0_SPOEX|nr:hypothetical protein HF086_015147 [Spodoptera exigua]